MWIQLLSKAATTGIKSKGNKGPEDTGPDAGKQDDNENIENQDVVDLGENKEKEKDIIKTFDVNEGKKKEVIKISDINAVSPNQNQSNGKNLIENNKKFLKEAGQKIENYKDLLPVLGNMLSELKSGNNKNLMVGMGDILKEVKLNFKEKVIEKLEKPNLKIYVGKFNKMLEAVKLHQFKEDEKKELSDLLALAGRNDEANLESILKFTKVGAIKSGVSINFCSSRDYYLRFHEEYFTIQKIRKSNSTVEFNMLLEAVFTNVLTRYASEK